jgi:hypothetical protein
MDHILCSDLFNIYTSYIPYQERPKLLHINKQIHSLYTKYFLTKDKQTFSNLKDILDNETFFNMLLGDNHQPFIKNLNDNDINTIHEYSYKKRELHIRISTYVVYPLKLAGYISNEPENIVDGYHNNLFALLVIPPLKENELCYITYPQNTSNLIQIFTNSHGNIISQFKKYDAEYHILKWMDNRVLYDVINGFFSSGEKWDMFANEMKNPNTIQTLKIIDSYNTFIKKIEM